MGFVATYLFYGAPLDPPVDWECSWGDFGSATAANSYIHDLTKSASPSIYWLGEKSKDSYRYVVVISESLVDHHNMIQEGIIAPAVTPVTFGVIPPFENWNLLLEKIFTGLNLEAPKIGWYMGTEYHS